MDMSNFNVPPEIQRKSHVTRIRLLPRVHFRFIGSTHNGEFQMHKSSWQRDIWISSFSL